MAAAIEEVVEANRSLHPAHLRRRHRVPRRAHPLLLRGDGRPLQRDLRRPGCAERQEAGELGDVDPVVAVMVATRWFFYFFTVEKCFGVPMHFGMSPEQAVDEFIRLLRYGLLPRHGEPQAGRCRETGTSRTLFGTALRRSTSAARHSTGRERPDQPRRGDLIMAQRSETTRRDLPVAASRRAPDAGGAGRCDGGTGAGPGCDGRAARTHRRRPAMQADDMADRGAGGSRGRTRADEEMTPERQYGEEIVVTARKREENVQKVPVAVTVTSGEVLEDTGAPDISVLQDYVPEPVGLRRPQPVDHADRLHARHRPGRPAVGRRPGRRPVPRRRLHRPPPGRAARRLRRASGSRCCAARRAPSTARTRSAAPSSTSAGRPPTTSRPSSRWSAAATTRRTCAPWSAARSSRASCAARWPSPRSSTTATATNLYTGRDVVGQGHHRLPRRPRLAAGGERHRAAQRRRLAGQRRAARLPAPAGQPVLPALPGRRRLSRRSATATTPRAAWRRSTAPTPRATR